MTLETAEAKMLLWKWLRRLSTSETRLGVTSGVHSHTSISS